MALLPRSSSCRRAMEDFRPEKGLEREGASHSDHPFQTKQGKQLISQALNPKASSRSCTSTLSCPKASQPSTFSGVIPHPPDCVFPPCSLGPPTLSRSPCTPVSSSAPSGTAGGSSWMAVPCPWAAPQPQAYLCRSCVADAFAVRCCTRDLALMGWEHRLHDWYVHGAITCTTGDSSSSRTPTSPHHAAKAETGRCQIIFVI